MTRALLSCLLVAVLVLTGPAMTLARGQSMAVGEMVLCTGTGPVTVPVDADGQPTGPAHICPDCMMSLALGVLPAVAAPVPPTALATTEPFGLHRTAAIARALRAPSARGPPLA
ncbi:hypothetical protein [Anianabacter salinae]|uniref:hypothetical protein n=1 Tax=Anianabacter salinae TaxID=2851023 RepID=UPI00225DDBD5|nr:hypothetical protein [Anianabacter salinae]MBV0911322.1 hypothetical protein [Anianabacter salinae]